MNVTTLMLTAVLVMFGATVSAMAGFGYAIATMPFMLMLYPPKTALALGMVVAFCGSIMQWTRVREHVNYRLAGLLGLGAAVGAPLGGLVLAAISPTALKLLISVAVLVAAVLSFVRKEAAGLPPRAPSPALAMVTGFASGTLATTTGQSGIPISFFIVWTRMDKQVARATMVTYFILVDFWSLITMARGGVLTGQIALNGLIVVPFYAVGILLGDRIFHRSSQGAYRRVIISVLSVAAAVGLINGISALVY